jgi:hypothetical protein
MNRKWKFAKAAADHISGVGILRCLAMFLWVPFGGVSAAGQTSPVEQLRFIDCSWSGLQHRGYFHS